MKFTKIMWKCYSLQTSRNIFCFFCEPLLFSDLIFHDWLLEVLPFLLKYLKLSHCVLFYGRLARKGQNAHTCADAASDLFGLREWLEFSLFKSVNDITWFIFRYVYDNYYTSCKYISDFTIKSNIFFHHLCRKIKISWCTEIESTNNHPRKGYTQYQFHRSVFRR